jgi:hypothetical protein
MNINEVDSVNESDEYYRGVYETMLLLVGYDTRNEVFSDVLDSLEERFKNKGFEWALKNLRDLKSQNAF